MVVSTSCNCAFMSRYMRLKARASRVGLCRSSLAFSAISDRRCIKANCCTNPRRSDRKLRVHEQVHAVEGESFAGGTLPVELSFFGHFRQTMHQGELLHESPAVAPRGLRHVRRHGREEAVELAGGDVFAVVESRHHGVRRNDAEGTADGESLKRGARPRSLWIGRRSGWRCCGLRPEGGCNREEQEGFHEVG